MPQPILCGASIHILHCTRTSPILTLSSTRPRQEHAMQTQDTGLKTVIKNVSTLMQETATKSEAAALQAIERVEASLAAAQAKWNDAKDIGGEVADTLGHAGRTSLSGVAEFNVALGRYIKEAVTDTIEFGRKTFKARSLRELVDL